MKGDSECLWSDFRKAAGRSGVKGNGQYGLAESTSGSRAGLGIVGYLGGRDFGLAKPPVGIVKRAGTDMNRRRTSVSKATLITTTIIHKGHRRKAYDNAQD